MVASGTHFGHGRQAFGYTEFMAHVTRQIGLSLGADICWPICFEQIMHRLKLAIPYRGDTVGFEVSRVTIEPFDLRQDVRYDLVIDRLTHWYHTSREWIKKAVVLNDLYVFNNPWSIQANEKHTTYCAMMRLGMPVPQTWMIPPKTYTRTADLEPTLKRYAQLFDLGEIGAKVGYPLFMKPYDGGGWKGVTKIDDVQMLRSTYDGSGTDIMHLQAGVVPYDRFVRCIGLGPQTRVVNYDPSAPLHDRYRPDVDFISADEARMLQDITLTINAFFGWDFNSCEALLKQHEWYPIDFANACPDSQVTSLHYHFPWLIKSNLRWAIFCATTQRRMRANLEWQPFFDAAAPEKSWRERLVDYARIARERFSTDEFEEFCTKHLSHLDEVAYEFFGSAEARDAVRQKVTALYPVHEIDTFTALFFERIQNWRAAEGRGG
jgi:hypothetical protein